MTLHDYPRVGRGFLYVLSNRSMPNLLKVGITENSVSQRINELTSTGVPTPFNAEMIFELEARLLRDVELETQKELKAHGVHHGKEFFNSSIEFCYTCITEVIFRITGNAAVELLGLHREQIAHNEARQNYLNERNEIIRSVREEWLRQYRETCELCWTWRVTSEQMVRRAMAEYPPDSISTMSESDFSNWKNAKWRFDPKISWKTTIIDGVVTLPPSNEILIHIPSSTVFKKGDFWRDSTANGFWTVSRRYPFAFDTEVYCVTYPTWSSDFTPW